MTPVARVALRPYWRTFEDFHAETEELIHAGEKHVVTAIRERGADKRER